MTPPRNRAPIATKRDLSRALEVMEAKGLSWAGLTILPGGGYCIVRDAAAIGLKPSNDSDDGGAAWDAALGDG